MTEPTKTKIVLVSGSGAWMVCARWLKADAVQNEPAHYIAGHVYPASDFGGSMEKAHAAALAHWRLLTAMPPAKLPNQLPHGFVEGERS